MLDLAPKGSSAVKDGVCLYTSPSALQTAEPKQGGCFRKWWYRYVLGLKDPPGPSQKLGTKTHKEIERYLRSGEAALGAVAMSAWHFIPAPDPRLEIEHKITPQDCFEIGSIPVKQIIDLINPTGEYIDPMGACRHDDTIEVLDWKTTGNMRYAKSGRDLVDTYQMTMYGVYVQRRFEVDRVRLSHVYMQTKGGRKSSKSTFVAPAEMLEPTWRKAEATARTIQDLAKETDINKIPPNLAACSSYGGCPYADRCPRTTQQTAEQIFGKVTSMSLLPPQQPEVSLAIATEIPPAFRAGLEFIEANGFGMPSFSGDAAKVYAQMMNFSPAAQGYSGQGKAGPVTISNPDDVARLASEVASAVGKEFVVPAAVLPADAPVSQPHAAALPVDGFPVQPPPAPEVPAQTAEAPAAEAPDETTPQQPPPEGQSPELAKCLDAAASGKWGPCKKPEIAKAFTELLEQKTSYVQQSVNMPMNVDVQVTPQDGAVRVYVDCIVPRAIDLGPVVREATETLCKQFGAADLRCAPKDGPLGYGNWRGALAAYVREGVTLEPGEYFIDTRGSELAEVFAEALGPLVVARGIR